MTWRTTVVLTVAVAIVGIYAWIDLRDWQPDSRPPPPEAQIRHLLSFAVGDVREVYLRHGTFAARLERRTDGWSGTTRANAIEDFLANLRELAEIAPIDVTPDSLHEFGLDPPQGVLELTLRHGPPATLLIGNRNPPSTAMYVQLGRNGRVLLTGAILAWELEKVIAAITSETSAGAPSQPDQRP